MYTSVSPIFISCLEKGAVIGSSILYKKHYKNHYLTLDVEDVEDEEDVQDVEYEED